MQIDLLPHTLKVLFTALVGATARSHYHLGHLLQPFWRLRFAKVRARQQAGGDDLLHGSVGSLTLASRVLTGGLLQRPNILQSLVTFIYLRRLLGYSFRRSVINRLFVVTLRVVLHGYDRTLATLVHDVDGLASFCRLPIP